MKMTQWMLYGAGLLLLATISCRTCQKSATDRCSAPAYAVQNLLPYARPMCGTGQTLGEPGDPNLRRVEDFSCTYPGATLPFGMIQWSPDTETGRYAGGYRERDKRISDFSVDHISGAGCNYGGNFAMMPILGQLPATPPDDRRAFALPFSHSNEIARPGYYAVTFDNDLKVELTTTLQTGFGRIIYPGSEPATLMINAGSDINGSAASGVNINPPNHEISGWSVGGRFCDTHEMRTIYFCAIFDRPFKNYSAWSDKALTPSATNGTGTTSGAFATFDTSANRTVLVKLGISYVSIANARANVQAENPVSAFTSKDFDKMAAAAGETWNAWLNKIQVSGGTQDQLVTFYSMLYHVLLGPVVVSDANGQYMGYDGQVHTTTDGRLQYGIISGWDIYRSHSQLLSMLSPKVASDVAQSLLVDYQQGGTFPRWGCISEDSGVMMGDPAAAIIADYYAFGATNFDAAAALAGLIRAATDPSVYAPRSKTYERDALEDYLKLGYVPQHQHGGYGNVSMTLEYASADFALSQFAKALGDETNSAMLLKQAQNWKNHFNPASGYLEMRRRDGSWAPGFTNNNAYYDNDQAYVEGTAGQYLWMVPFNLKGLAEMLGGIDTATKRLDAFFTRLNVSDRGPNAWMAWVGNEPCLGTPWIYDFWGQPWKTQDIVRRAMMELYGPGNNAYPGNDDAGQMSSWYLFSALGMYPELPGSDILVLGSPLFPKAVLHLPHGDVTIIGNGAAPEAPYVQSLTVNGQAWNKPWLRYSDISNGGTLVFELGRNASTNWGSNLADAPPSYSGESN